MAFPLLTLRQSGACETSANESFTVVEKNFFVEPGYSNKNSKKNSDKHKRAGEDGKREKASLGPVNGRFAYESFRERPVR